MKLYGKLHYQQEMCILSAGYGRMIFSSAVFEENLRYCHSPLVLPRRRRCPQTLTLAITFAILKIAT